MQTHAQIIADLLSVSATYVQNVIDLMDGGNTIPFIARYRKEMHGTMDDTQLRKLAEKLESLRSVDARRAAIVSSIEGQGKLTDELVQALDQALTLSALEDIYRPYKQKRRTRATMAQEKGLTPLADALYAQARDGQAPEVLATAYINPELGVETIEDALSGASDIIAEYVSDNADVRTALRQVMQRLSVLSSKAAQEGDSVYQLYYDFKSPLNRVLPHQTLAIDRGEREDWLKVTLDTPEQDALVCIKRKILIPATPSTAFVATAIEDAYRRLLAPSMEREARANLTAVACDGAIDNFARNLKGLLLYPPVKGKVTLGLDPAYRTGCKLAVVDATGRVLATDVIYPTQPHNKIEQANRTITQLVRKFGITAIAIGNGTASRESEDFIAKLLPSLPHAVSYMVVSEAGASVYSASPLAAEEFPEYDVSLRSAVSIARRMQDPLAELVKIDPKAIGVGQYQHDMPQGKLMESLDGVVEDCVNAVGADVNTASAPLLSRIAGLNATTAKNVVAYREENGMFTSRAQLKKVPRLGAKAFEQCAGFLRIPESKSVLDNTGVHPESYKAAEKLLQLCDYTPADVRNNAVSLLSARVEEQGAKTLAQACDIGVPTLRDLVHELTKVGRDMREELPPPLLRTAAMELKDLKPGMELDGTVRNVIDFGAFVDIGVHQDGLVHISRLSKQRVKHPSEVVAVGDVVKVTVVEVDVRKKRIALSMNGKM